MNVRGILNLSDILNQRVIWQVPTKSHPSFTLSDSSLYMCHWILSNILSKENVGYQELNYCFKDAIDAYNWTTPISGMLFQIECELCVFCRNLPFEAQMHFKSKSNFESRRYFDSKGNFESKCHLSVRKILNLRVIWFSGKFWV